jgi:Ca2+-binding EF-hand superfamily protein
MQVERNQSNTSLPKSSEPPFPSDKELAQFQKQSKFHLVSFPPCLIDIWREFRQGTNSTNGRIKKSNFIRILKKNLKLNNDSIAEALFKRNFYIGFGVRKYEGKGQIETIIERIKLHDIMLALTLLSRIPADKKVELIFNLTDVDEDGCLSNDEIYKMIEVIERIFAKENTDMKIASRILLEELSRDKAARRYDWVMRSVVMLKNKNKNDEGLITFEEFQNVLNKVPNLKAQFLPRYIDIKSVLRNENSEPEIKVNENHLEDFLVFRYELQALLSGTMKSDRKKKLPPVKKPVKTNEEKYYHKECPGLITTGNLGSKLDIPEEYWEINSRSNQFFVKERTEKGGFDYKKYDKDKAIQKIVPQRPVQKALQEIKRDIENVKHNKYDDEEAAGYEALVSKVHGQVEDTKKKKTEVGEVQTITRKMDLKTINDRGNGF